jgi:AcrR family transcriptional regulator
LEDKKNLTRSTILKAANKCFDQEGYLKTTCQKIAQTAGISRALLYLYFNSKEQLFMTVTSETHQRSTEQSREVLKSQLSSKEKLERIIDIWVLDPYRTIKNTPAPDSWLDVLSSVAASETNFRNQFCEALAPLLGQNLAEIVVLAYRGLMDDRPQTEVLGKRSKTLVDVIVKAGGW